MIQVNLIEKGNKVEEWDLNAINSEFESNKSLSLLLLVPHLDIVLLVFLYKLIPFVRIKSIGDLQHLLIVSNGCFNNREGVGALDFCPQRIDLRLYLRILLDLFFLEIFHLI